MTDAPPDIQTAIAEIKRLHVFLQDWITGSAPQTDAEFASRFSDHLAENFQLVQPGGEVSDRNATLDAIWGLHGKNPPFRIQIRNPRPVLTGAKGVISVLYEEWQREALNALRANNGRVSTAIFDITDRPGQPLKWAFIHETWLPDRVIDQAVFDF